MSLNSTIKQQFTYQLAPGSLSDNEFHNRHKKNVLPFVELAFGAAFLLLPLGSFSPEDMIAKPGVVITTTQQKLTNIS